jgi:hypothetical protein
VAGHIRLLSLLLAFDQGPAKQIEQLHRLANERLIRTQTQGKPQENLCAKLALNDGKWRATTGNDGQLSR